MQALGDSQEEDDLLKPFTSNPIYIGGFRSDGRSLYMIHGHKLRGSAEVCS